MRYVNDLISNLFFIEQCKDPTDAEDALLCIGGLACDIVHCADVGHRAAEALVKIAGRQIERQGQQP